MAEQDTVARPQTFPCRECGGDLRFEPGSSDLVCPYCGTRNTIEDETPAVAELDYRLHLEANAHRAETVERDVLKCGTCAAEVEPPPHVTALDCPFCGSALVAVAQTRVLIRPGWVLPFHVDAATAGAAYRAWLSKRWFAPSNLKAYARQQDRLRGIYLPYWTYDADVTSRYTGQRGDNYTVTVGSGKNQRRETRTRWSAAAGRVRSVFDDILIVASRTLPREDLRALEPWDQDSIVPYADEYLAGFSAESYQVDLPSGFELAAEIMDGEIRTSIHRDIGGDKQRIDTVDNSWHAITFKHLLLPVWVTAYRYRDTVYRVMVNARTGEVRGQRPWSWIKITLTVLAVLAGVAIVALVASRV